MIHDEPHPKSGQIVQVAIHPGALPNTLPASAAAGTAPNGILLFDFCIEDWEDRMSYSDLTLWQRPMENFAQTGYAFRCGMAFGLGEVIPRDAEIIYGKIGSLGYLVHATEIRHSF